MVLMSVSLQRRLAKAFLSMGGIGFLPLAPGTWGSAVGLSLVATLHAVFINPFVAVGFDIALVFILGVLSLLAMRALPSGGRSDEQFIVTDEFMGVTIAYMPSVFLNGHPLSELLAAFVLFRILDVWKPLLIRKVDSLHTPLSVLLDDVLSGIVAAACLIAAFVGAI